MLFYLVFLAASSFDTARVEEKSPATKAALFDQDIRVECIHLSRCARLILVAGGSQGGGDWKAFDLSTGACLIDGTKGKLRCGVSWGACISPDKSLLAVGGNAGRLFVANARSGDLNWDISKKIEFGVVHDLQFTPDNRYLVSRITDMSIRVWDIREKKQHTIFGFKPVRVRDNLWSGFSEHNRPNRLFVVPGEYDLAMTFAISPDGRTMAVAGNLDGVVPLVSLETGKVLKTLKLKQPSSHSLTYSADGKWLLVAGPARGPTQRKGRVHDKDPIIEIWDVEKNQMVTSLGKHERSISHMAISPDKKTIISGGGDDGFRIWDVATGKQKFSYFTKEDPRMPKVKVGMDDLKRYVQDAARSAGCAFLPDGKTFVIVPHWTFWKTEIYFHDTTTGRPVDFRARVKALPPTAKAPKR